MPRSFRHAVLRCAALSAGLLLALTSCSQDPAPSTSPEDPTTTSPSAAAESPSAQAPAAIMPLSELCGSGCTITGDEPIEHPEWGELRIVTMLADQATDDPGHVAAVDSEDGVVWFEETMERLLTLEPAQQVQDADGIVLLKYNPGRYDGVIALAPTASGFDDLHTLPADDYDKRFYNASPTMSEDGTYVIWHVVNDCEPACAAGPDTEQPFEWDGSDFVPTGPPEQVGSEGVQHGSADW